MLLSLCLSFCPGFLLGRAELSGLRFVHFYLFRCPQAFAYLVYLRKVRKVFSFRDSDGLIVFRKACRF